VPLPDEPAGVEQQKEYWNPRDAEDIAEHALMVTRR
jgi:hypothetical protein